MQEVPDVKRLTIAIVHLATMVQLVTTNKQVTHVVVLKSIVEKLVRTMNHHVNQILVKMVASVQKLILASSVSVRAGITGSYVTLLTTVL